LTEAFPIGNEERGKRPRVVPWKKLFLSYPYNWRSGVVYRGDGKR